MREIKFRAWHKEEKFMYQVDALEFPVGGTIWYGPGVGKGVASTNSKYNLVVDSILMQFTGLLDKNGKAVYEGDILKLSSGERREVLWRAALACFQHEALEYSQWGQLDEIMATKCEIIGNIYENPELLQEQQ